MAENRVTCYIIAGSDTLANNLTRVQGGGPCTLQTLTQEWTAHLSQNQEKVEISFIFEKDSGTHVPVAGNQVPHCCMDGLVVQRCSVLVTRQS